MDDHVLPRERLAAIRRSRPFLLAFLARRVRNGRFWAVLVGYIMLAAAAMLMAMRGVDDAIGYLASFLVLGSFASQSMISLRILATFSNIAFVAYATQRHLPPVLVLHATLLPVNLFRITQLLGLTGIATRSCLALAKNAFTGQAKQTR
jgi:hypothetical protein